MARLTSGDPGEESTDPKVWLAGVFDRAAVACSSSLRPSASSGFVVRPLSESSGGHPPTGFHSDSRR